jgi:MoaA/NifB/PqqE/SkfB family radical SAM enzyme
MELNKKYFNNRRWDFDELPDLVMIETVIGCNLRCEMCPVPNSKLLMNGRTTTTMKLETFHRILEEIADKPRRLHLNQMGEPLLNKTIFEFVTLAKKSGHIVSLTTNGTLMNEDIARKLLIAGVDHITFSVDGYEARTYESIRIGANYEEVRSNIEQFCRLRKDLNKNTSVQIDCILSDLTRSEIASMQNYWLNKVDCINAINLDDWAGKHILPSKFGVRNWVESASGKSRYPCDLLWTTIAISAEGFVMYCCHDYKLLSNLPNVNEKSLKQIWKDRVSEERKKHCEERIDKDPCVLCDAWKTRQPYFCQPSLVHIVANVILKKIRWIANKYIQE